MVNDALRPGSRGIALAGWAVGLCGLAGAWSPLIVIAGVAFVAAALASVGEAAPPERLNGAPYPRALWTGGLAVVGVGWLIFGLT